MIGAPRAGQYSLEGPMKNLHFFFWGQKQTLWNSPADCAVLVQASAWQTSAKGVQRLGDLMSNASTLYGKK
jgi:hypothetical protein